jgi:hypothetical protein
MPFICRLQLAALAVSPCLLRVTWLWIQLFTDHSLHGTPVTTSSKITLQPGKGPTSCRRSTLNETARLEDSSSFGRVANRFQSPHLWEGGCLTGPDGDSDCKALGGGSSAGSFEI